nr:MAG TPA: Head fiber protein [Caudoviricetes sp.]
MGINFQTQKLAGHFPELWRGESKVLPGGFKPANTLAIGTVVRPGTPLFVDFDTRSAAVCKTAKVENGGTTTAPRVAKGHYFAAGDSVAVNGGGVVAIVKSVDASNDAYDVITFDKALTGVKADDVLIEPAAELVDSKAVAKYAPNMVAPLFKEIKATGINTLDAAYDAVVLIPSLAATPMLPEWLNGCCLAANPNIIYIKQ